MTVMRGNVVLVEVVFANQQASMFRPALIIQSDHNNQRLQNTIIAVITSNLSRVDKAATQVLIDISSVAGQKTGLLKNSVVSCENIQTIEQRQIARVIGNLSNEFLAEVDQALLVSLGIERA